MSKTRTWILSIAVALGLTNLCQAQPRTVGFVPSTYPGTSQYAGAPYTIGQFSNYHVAGHDGIANGGHLHGRNGSCSTCGGHGLCPRQHCPPPYKHCMEGPPRLRFRKGCPAPVCSPCDAPNWGYFQPCWNPWPWPPDWSHCPTIPPAATVAPGPLVGAVVPDVVIPPVRKPGL